MSYCQLNCQLIEHPDPVGHGWGIINGKCRLVCYTCAALPSSFDKCNPPDDYDSESSSDGSESDPGNSSDSDN